MHSDDDEVAVLRERVDVAVEVFCADDVEDDVRAVPVGGGLELLDEVLLLVVNEDVRAVLLAGRELLGGAGRHRDGGLHRLRQLDREQPDAATAAVDEQGVTGLQVGRHEDIRPDGGGDLHEAGSFGEAIALRDRHQLAVGNSRVLRITPAGQ